MLLKKRVALAVGSGLVVAPVLASAQTTDPFSSIVTAVNFGSLATDLGTVAVAIIGILLVPVGFRFIKKML